MDRSEITWFALIIDGMILAECILLVAILQIYGKPEPELIRYVGGGSAGILFLYLAGEFRGRVPKPESM